MSALSYLLASSTSLTAEQTEHLQQLVAEWQLLSDMSFADLLLWVPTSPDGQFLCAAQCRPTTGPTAYLHDRVGETLADNRALQIAITESRIFRESDPEWEDGTPIRREAIPIVFEGQTIAVLGRDSNLTSVRSPSQLELAYLQSASDLAAMVATGQWPGPASQREEGAGPRVGDGMVRVDAEGRVLYASPNGSSALRRLGFNGNLQGELFAEAVAALAHDPFQATDLAEMVGEALSGIHPTSREVDSGGGAIVQLRAIPLFPRGESLGALILLQDVTELRSRDRQIMSKDATIREIHHRVKNNLQTVAALLRLQSRRVANAEARTALEESMRRVSSIALVHETLSSAIDEEVAFDEVVDRLLEMLAEVSGTAGRIRVQRTGSFGELPAELATPLVMVLTELVGNAVEHGFPDDDAGTVEVRGSRDRGNLVVDILDDGAGLPEKFSLGGSDRLGLQIVQTLVSAELDASMDLARRTGEGERGTAVQLRIPLRRVASL